MQVTIWLKKLRRKIAGAENGMPSGLFMVTLGWYLTVSRLKIADIQVLGGSSICDRHWSYRFALISMRARQETLNTY